MHLPIKQRGCSPTYVNIELAREMSTKNYEGTTTQDPYPFPAVLLYHTKNYEGTTTPYRSHRIGEPLYYFKTAKRLLDIPVYLL